jgi:hypothetical protein
MLLQQQVHLDLCKQMLVNLHSCKLVVLQQQLLHSKVAWMEQPLPQLALL